MSEIFVMLLYSFLEHVERDVDYFITRNKIRNVVIDSHSINS